MRGFGTRKTVSYEDQHPTEATIMGRKVNLPLGRMTFRVIELQPKPGQYIGRHREPQDERGFVAKALLESDIAHEVVVLALQPGYRHGLTSTSQLAVRQVEGNNTLQYYRVGESKSIDPEVAYAKLATVITGQDLNVMSELLYAHPELHNI